MAQTEALMLIGLGFVLALLLVMAFGRGVWTLSNSYARRQRTRDLPAAMLSLEADRDRLRAENAAMASKLEVVSENAKAAIAGQTAEVARHRNRVVGLTEDINEKAVELNAKAGHVDDLKVQLQDLGETLGLQQRAARELAADNAEKEAIITRLEGASDALRQDIIQSKSECDRLTALLENALAECADLKQEMAVAVSLAARNPRETLVPDFSHSPESGQPAEGLSDHPAATEQAQKITTQLVTQSRAGRFDFDRSASLNVVRPEPLPHARQTDIKEVLLEARRDLIDLARAHPAGDAGSDQAQSVISLAKRLRALQTESDEKVSKKLK